MNVEPKRFSKLLVVPLKPEWTHLKQKYQFARVPDFNNLFVIENILGAALLQVGCGMEQAACVMADFFKRYAADSVLHFGSCGALITNLKTGTVVVANSQDELIHFLEKSKTSFEVGKIFTSPSVLKNSTEKTNCAKEHNAIAVDMESSAIIAACEKNQARCLVVRGVFDELEDNLEDLGEPYDVHGELKPGKMALSLIKSPKLILQIPALQKKASLVNRNLARVVEWFLG